MDRYKISQSTVKKRLIKPIKTIRSKSVMLKALNAKRSLVVVGGALGLIAIGVVIAVFTLHSKPSKANQNGSSLKVASQASAISPAAYNAITNGVTNKNLSILGSYCAPNVHIIIVSSGVNETLSCKQAIGIVDSAIQGAENPWNFHLPASEISAWETGPYGQDLSGTNIVGESSNGEVISIGFNSSGQVTTIIVLPIGSLTNNGSSTSNTSTTPGSSTSSPSPGSNTNYIPPGNPTPNGAID